MSKPNEDGVVLQKTLELCQAILDQPELVSARRSITAFMSDDQARAQYEGVMVKGQELQRKQQAAQPLLQDEISDFETSRNRLLDNPVARNFLGAQEQMQRVHQTVNEYVGKTLELGRVPTAEDFQEESCGEGCGCGHNH